ncbi:MAG TPA: anti-repressor SinI family protein [Candidatus Bathyarchaeia archaeon]|nr:anti-repressor SinI family protein [Candidatus Bathyarchaeia archaeon]
MENKVKHRELDMEWLDLILRARQLGLTPEEVRAFLSKEGTGMSIYSDGDIREYYAVR